MSVSVRVLRELFRNLQSWQALYETEGKDTLQAPNGQQFCLHDVKKLYELSQSSLPGPDGKPVPVLSPRQAEAIRLFLYENIKERDVAVMMGVSPSNPVASYATQGMVRLVELINCGQLPGITYDGDELGVAA